MNPTGGVETATGTSLAAPVVAGSAVLIAAEPPTLDGAALRERLLDPGGVFDAPPNPCTGGLAEWNTRFLFASAAVP